MHSKLLIILGIFLGLAILLSSDKGYSSGDEEKLYLSSKEIIERLTRLEEGQKALNKRIDDVRDELKGDINDLKSLVYVLLGGIIALIAIVIWDRRSALSPVIRRTRELESDYDLTLRILKEYGKREPKFAEVLRSFGLL